MTNRKHLTPPQGVPVQGGVHPVRRGGARRDTGDRVVLKSDDGASLDGWALNVSRGGVRVILEERVALGTSFEVTIGEEVNLTRRARIVWLQEEPDGVVVGLEFVGLSQSMQSAPPAAPDGAEILPKEDD